MADLNCPYCLKELDVCHDDGFGCQEDVNHQMECSHCGKSFVFQTTIVFYYDAYKADCLNDGNHEWKPMTTYPVELTDMECQMCGEIRKPTAEEMAEIMRCDHAKD